MFKCSYCHGTAFNRTMTGAVCAGCGASATTAHATFDPQVIDGLKRDMLGLISAMISTRIDFNVNLGVGNDE